FCTGSADLAPLRPNHEEPAIVPELIHQGNILARNLCNKGVELCVQGLVDLRHDLPHHFPASTFRMRLPGRPVGFNPAFFCAALIAVMVRGPISPSASPL